VKRDWETLRWLLLQAEECKAGRSLLCLRPGTDISDEGNILKVEVEKFEDVVEHILLLRDIGFAEIKELRPTFKGTTGASILCLTSAGHDFLEAARNDTAWNKTKKTAGEVGGVTVTFFRDLLFGYVKAELQKATGVSLG
jgi:hypothetical protein